MKKPIPFGKYYLLERINVGGMAEVFRAKAFGVEGFERLVAVKRILPNIAEDKEFITMFVDEAKIAVQLNHANIAQIFDLGVVENAYYIALEHVWGRDLRAIFERCRQRGEPMPVAQACFVMMKMCEGLDYAHNKRDAQGRDMNLVHRDVSPQNVLVSFEGEVKIIDFGIAKAAGKVGRTQQGILKGKFGYMSPEQVRGLPVDRRSDVFAVGIVLYEMLTGERLFVGESDFSTLEKVRNVEILPPSTYNRKIPDELERIVLKALAKDVDDRYQNAIDLHDELQAFVYTAGEFYSRKDLASWMKKTFVKEIQEETAKLETYRQLTPADTGERPQIPDSAARTERNERPDRPDRADRGERERPLEKRPTSASPRASAHVVPAGQNVRRTQQVAVPPPVSPGNGRSSRMPAQALSGGASQQQVASAGPSAKTMPPPVVDPTHELEWDEDELETQIYDTPGAEPAEPEAKPAKSAAAPALKVVPRPASSPPILYPEPDPALGIAPTLREDRGKHVPPPKTAAAGSGPRGAPKAEDTLAVRGTVIPDIKVRRPPSPLRVWLFVGAAVVVVGVAFIVFTSTGNNSAKTVASADDKTGAAAADKTAETAKPKEEAAPAPQLPVDPNSGFDLTTDPVGSKVRLDGNIIGVAPLRVRSLLAGKHTLELTAPSGTPTMTKEIVVDQGQAIVLNLKVDEASAAVAASAPAVAQTTVMVNFTSDPSGAKVSLIGDGTKIPFGNTPFEAKVDMTKKYQALYELDGYESQQKPIVGGSDPNLTLPATLVRVQRVAAASAPVVTQVAAVTPPAPLAPVTPPPAPKHDTPRKVAVATPNHESSHEPTHEPAPSKPSHTPAPPRETPDNPRETGAPDAIPVSGGSGKLWIGAKPQCNIFLDGTDIGRTTPVRDLDVKSGTHTVTLVNAEFGIKEKVTVTVRAGEATKVIKDYSDRIPQ